MKDMSVTSATDFPFNPIEQPLQGILQVTLWKSQSGQAIQVEDEV